MKISFISLVGLLALSQSMSCARTPADDAAEVADPDTDAVGLQGPSAIRYSSQHIAETSVGTTFHSSCNLNRGTDANQLVHTEFYQVTIAPDELQSILADPTDKDIVLLAAIGGDIMTSASRTTSRAHSEVHWNLRVDMMWPGGCVIPLDLTTEAPAMHCVDTLTHATYDFPYGSPIVANSPNNFDCNTVSTEIGRVAKDNGFLRSVPQGEPLIFVIRIESTYDTSCDINQANGRPAGRGDATAAIEMYFPSVDLADPR